MIVRLAVAVLSAIGVRWGTATTFYPTERWNNGWAACLHRPLRADDVGVALPVRYACGSEVLVVSRRSGRAAVFLVIDRGPRRALVDLTARAAQQIGSSGREPVWMMPMPPRQKIAWFTRAGR